MTNLTQDGKQFYSHYHVIVRAVLIYRSDFIVCTDRTIVCFNMSSYREKNVTLEMLL